MSDTTTLPNELSPHIRVEFARKAQNLQMLPTVAIQALDIAKNPECSIREFVSVIERDAKLATDILGMSNSAMFWTGGAPIISLQQSVVRLGFRQCRNLILSTSLASMMRNMSLAEEWIRDVLSQHAFVTGLTAVHVNRIVGTGFQGEEFAAGLIHDFGRALIAVCMPDQFASADPLDFEENSETPTKESWLLETNHCQAGAWFAQINSLPSEFVETIRHHHAPQNAVKHRRLVALTAISDHIANHMQRFETSENYDITTNEAIYILEGTGIANVGGRLQDLIADIMESTRREAQDLMSN
jgi:HD-like signal output (HDOD) protein